MRTARVLFPAALFLLPTACGSDPLVPTSGTLAVTTATTGDQPDADGYTVQLDSEQPRSIGTTASLDPIELPTGDHVITLGGLAPNCAVGGENPRTISVLEASTTTIEFEVTCSATFGSVRVITNTSGVDLDPDGYTVSADGVSPRSIGAHSVVTVMAAPGAREIALSGLEPNCQVDGQNPRVATVPTGSAIDLSFNIKCVVVRGSRILFQSGRGSGGLYTVRPDGSRLTNVALGSRSYAASWSPDGSKIAFITDPDASNNASLSVMNADGTGLSTLSQGSFWPTPPSWSPDGQRIAFIAPGVGDAVGTQVFIIGIDGSGRQQLTHGVGISDFASWSPKGSSIAFYRTGAHQILTVTVDGTREDSLSMPGIKEQDFIPLWSPDGSKIAFIRQYADYQLELIVQNLWVMNADGSQQVALTHFPADPWTGTVDKFAWAPDGDGLVFSNLGQISRVQPDGTGLTRLSYNVWPVWSPDASRFVFEAPGEGGSTDIFVMDAGGGNVVNVSHDPSWDFAPQWQP